MSQIQMRPVPAGLAIDITGALGRDGGEAIVRLVQGQATPPGRLVLNFTHAGPINTAGLGGVLWVVRLVTKAGGRWPTA